MKKFSLLLTAAAVFAAAFIYAAPAEAPENFPEPPAYPESAQEEISVPTPAMDTMVVEAVKGPEWIELRPEGLAVVLKWKTAPSAVSYDIYRSTAPDSGFEKINKEAVKADTYTDNVFFSISPPKHAVKNYYRVVFTDAEGRESEDSETAEALPVGPLMPPKNLKVSATADSAFITWEAPDATGNTGLAGYDIYRSAGAEPDSKLNTVTLKTAAYTDAGLGEGVLYTYKVQSVDLNGNVSQYAGPVQAVPFSSISAPRKVTATAVSSESIKVSWEAPESLGTYGVSYYNIFRSTDPMKPAEKPVNERPARLMQDEAGYFFYFDNIINSETQPETGVDYYYSVVPVDVNGNSGAASQPLSYKIPYMKIEKSGILSADVSQYGLPPESVLKLSGRKTFDFVQKNTWYTGQRIPSYIADRYVSSLDIRQTFRLKLEGNIGKNILVNVDYDDTRLIGDETTKIIIQYKGDVQDAVQEAVFGDITLSFPGTKYVSFSESLFGLQLKAGLGDRFTLSAVAAQTKGISEKQTFTGRLRKKEENGKEGRVIYDREFLNGTYYYITKDPSQVSAFNPSYTGEPVYIKPGTVEVYIDDRDETNNFGNTFVTETGRYKFDRRYLGNDFTIDYLNGVIKFSSYIPDRYVIAVAYETTDGQRVGYTGSGTFDFSESGLVSAADGYTSNSAHLVQRGSDNTSIVDMSHKIVSYYYIGDQNIFNPKTDTDYFRIYAYRIDGNADIGLPQPWEAGADRFYEIDTDLGIIKFKAVFPFSLNAASPADPADTQTQINSGTEADAYNVNPSSVKSNYRIELKYRYYVSSYRLDNSPVVAGSERIIVDGELLRKDKDYYIIYETGDITFVQQDRIMPESRIEIYYEYSPFFQTFQNNLLGGRAEYKLLDNLTLGGTLLMKAANAGSDVPDARSTDRTISTPFSSYIADGDIKLDIKRKDINFIINSLPFVSGVEIPVDIEVRGEAAYSDFNPNLKDVADERGVAMIDNMEGADTIRSANMTLTNWFPASLPQGYQPEDRKYFTKKEESAQGHEPVNVNDPLSFDYKKMMRLDYDGLAAGQWDAFRNIISASGENLNLFNYLEMWVYVDTDSPVKLFLDVGIISEDSNGNNRFEYNSETGVRRDSEDVEQNGRKTPENDIGISSGIYPSNPAYWGAGNDWLDTEDMNSNGVLDTTEKFYRFTYDAAPGYIYGNHAQFRLEGKGWRNIKIPLREPSDAPGTTAGEKDTDPKNTLYMSMIRHLRVGLTGGGSTPAKGHVIIESIEFKGNSWSLSVLPSVDLAGNVVTSPDINKLNVFSLNKNTDPNYVPNTKFYNYRTEEDKKFEEALQMNYTQSGFDLAPDGRPLYYTTKFVNNSSGYDYGAYRYLKMDLFYKKKDKLAGPGKVLFVRLGKNPSDDTRDYYQYNASLDDIPDDGAWHTVTFELDGSDKLRGAAVGEPNLRTVRHISLGVINPNSTSVTEQIYVNNIRLTEPYAKKGTAKYMSTAFRVDGFGTLTHQLEDRETDFKTLADIGKAGQQHTTTNSLIISYGQLPFLPVNINISKTERYTEEAYKNDISFTDNFTLSDYTDQFYSGFYTFSLIPNVTLSGSASYNDTDYEYFKHNSYLSNNTKRFTGQQRAVWKLPETFIIVPIGNNTAEASIKYSNREITYPGPQGLTFAANLYSNWNLNREQYYKWTGSYALGSFSLTPSYDYKLVEEKGNLAAVFEYYKDSIGLYNYVDRYFVFSREVNPKVTFSMRDAWIFSPRIDYSNNYRMDYAGNRLSTTGSLSASTGVSFSKLLNFLPDITSYTASIRLNETFDNQIYKDTFSRFGALSFEQQWNVTMWNYAIGSKNSEGLLDIEKIEAISSYGALSLSHDIMFSQFVFGEILSFQPSGGYRKGRNSTSRSVSLLNDTWNLWVRNISIYNPFEAAFPDLFKGRRITGDYSYTIGIDSDPKDTAKLLGSNETHSASLQVNFAKSDEKTGKELFNGNFRIMGGNSNTIQSQIFKWRWTLDPALTFNFFVDLKDPIKIWDWMPVIGGRVIELTQTINIRSVLSASLIKAGGIGDNNASKWDTQKYTAGIGADYKALQNLNVRANADFSYLNDSIDNTLSKAELALSIGADLEF